MRQLHPVAFHERFTSSGIYRFEQDGKTTGVTEAWTIHQLPDQSLMTRVDHYVPAADEVSFLLEALVDKENKLERFDIRLDLPADYPARQVRASYQIFEQQVRIGWQVDEQPRNEATVQLATGTLIYLGALVFLGHLIRQLDQQSTLIYRVDWHRCYLQEALIGQIERGFSKRTASEPQQVAQTSIQTNQYQLAGIGFNEKANFWLDEHDMLVNYSDGNKHVALTRYAPFSKTKL